MQILKKISILSLSLLMLAACGKDDNVPEIDTTAVNQEQILGGWGINATKAYVNVNPDAKPFLATVDLSRKLQDKLDEKATGASFYFKEEIVYFLRDEVVQDSSKYTLGEYKIYLDNPELIGFYAPVFYIKFSGDLFVTYLRKEETLELLEKDKGISSSDMNLIRMAVEDTQCELRFQRNYLPIYDELQLSDLP